MNNNSFKALVALIALTSATQAWAIPVQLVQNGLRAGSGTAYSMVMTGSTATWDWTDGILTQTGGVLLAAQWLSSSPASGQLILTDEVSGLVINTNTGTTTAASYRCIEGNFGAGTGAHSCGNIAWGDNFVYESTVTYNVGGMADCQSFALGGDDSGGVPQRGLRSWDGTGAGCADNTGRGALDMINIIENSLASGGILKLGNANGVVDLSCYTHPAASNAACGRAHWLTFTAVPLPSAAWLLAPAFGLAAPWVRRRQRR